MGNNQSTTSVIKWKLSHALPDYNHSSWCENKKDRPYNTEKDREQFIYGIAVVISNNGQIDLRDHNFALLYSRRANDRLVARIVAEKDGVITAKIDGAGDGKDQNDAFKSLRRLVELKLDKLLEDVPGPSAEGESVGAGGNGVSPVPALSAVQPLQTRRNIPIDAPPAYGTGDHKIQR